MLHFDEGTRIVYFEDDGSCVTLDVNDVEVVLRRVGDWTTHGLFSKNKSWLNVYSPEGRLDVEIDTIEIRHTEDSVSVTYHILSGNEVVDVFDYTCSWVKEEDTWLEVH